MVNIASFVHKFKSACLLLCLLSVAVSGCASGKLTRARDAFYDGQPEQAAAVLSAPEDVSSRDRLLYFMEKGAILHHNGDYQGSTDNLLNATALMREQDIISAGQQTASLVTNEWLTDYKGEYAERLLVHTYLMMNFLMLGNHESALVEAKQALEVYDDTCPEACANDFFTRALIAHCFEALNEINGAYIEYKKLAGLMPDPSPVARKLYDLANRLGFDDDAERFSRFLSESELNRGKRPAGEVIVFAGQGRSPVKIPHNIVVPPSIRFSFSTYEDRSPYLSPPSVGPLAGSANIIAADIITADIITTDVGEILKASLKERLARILVKETARVVTKEAVANNIDNDGLEILIRIFFFLTEVPDTRCWQTLPAYFSMIRVPLSPEAGPIRLKGLGHPVTLPEIDNPAGDGPFYHYYSIRNGMGPVYRAGH